MLPSFQISDMSGQTVQTQVRQLFLLGIQCLLFHLHLLEAEQKNSLDPNKSVEHNLVSEY